MASFLSFLPSEYWPVRFHLLIFVVLVLVIHPLASALGKETVFQACSSQSRISRFLHYDCLRFGLVNAIAWLACLLHCLDLVSTQRRLCRF